MTKMYDLKKMDMAGIEKICNLVLATEILHQQEMYVKKLIPIVLNPTLFLSELDETIEDLTKEHHEGSEMGFIGNFLK